MSIETAVDAVEIDELIAAALRKEQLSWPNAWSRREQITQVLARISYHGVAGLLATDKQILENWPFTIRQQLRDRAIASAMWELRHKALLATLFTTLAQAQVIAVLVKGSAVAYDLYRVPAARSRGDTDLWIAESEVRTTRLILETLGYRRQAYGRVEDDLVFQETWSLDFQGARHEIDLHWQLLNAPALTGLLQFDACAANSRPLPSLSPHARTLSRPFILLHACLHRAMHISSPYIVDDKFYYGGDRLIWLYDIHLLASALTNNDWRELATESTNKGIARVTLQGLRLANHWLGTAIPFEVEEELARARLEPASTYLLDRKQIGRAWQDLATMSGRRKFRYLRTRVWPPENFMRTKYPHLARMPLPVLHAQRLIDFVRRRPGT